MISNKVAAEMKKQAGGVTFMYESKKDLTLIFWPLWFLKIFIFAKYKKKRKHDNDAAPPASYII